MPSQSTGAAPPPPRFSQSKSFYEASLVGKATVSIQVHKGLAAELPRGKGALGGSHVYCIQRGRFEGGRGRGRGRGTRAVAAAWQRCDPLAVTVGDVDVPVADAAVGGADSCDRDDSRTSVGGSERK